MRYQFIEEAKKAFPITILCKVMCVTRSGFYAWRKNNGKSITEAKNEKLVPLVRKIHREGDGTYGTRSIARELRKLGIPCGRDKARILMKLAGVRVKRHKKFRATTDSKHNLPVAPNLLDRNFEVTEPNKVWVSDITYIWTAQGWLYLAVIIDLFSRKVVGWSLNKRINRELVINAFLMAVWRRKPAYGLMFHSDRGSQYCSADFQKTLKTHKAICSMSRKGNCWDNAVAESFFRSLKTERVYFRKYQTREEARRDIIDYIEMFYNSKRRHSTLGYLNPMEFEAENILKKAA